MIAILYSLINVITLQMSLIISDIVYLLGTPLGAIGVTTSVIYLEYLVIDKLLRDPNEFIFKAVITYTRNHILKNHIRIKNIPNNAIVPIIVQEN